MERFVVFFCDFTVDCFCSLVQSNTHKASFAFEVKELKEFESALPPAGGGGGGGGGCFAGRPKVASNKEFQNLGLGKTSQDMCSTSALGEALESLLGRRLQKVPSSESSTCIDSYCQNVCSITESVFLEAAFWQSDRGSIKKIMFFKNSQRN